jgi:hypothetical protein
MPTFLPWACAFLLMPPKFGFFSFVGGKRWPTSIVPTIVGHRGMVFE